MGSSLPSVFLPVPLLLREDVSLPLLDPSLDGDGLSFVWKILDLLVEVLGSEDRRILDGLDEDVVVGSDEVKDSNSIQLGLVDLRSDDSVDGGLEVGSGEKIQCIGDVDG